MPRTKALNPFEPVWYTPKAEEGEETPVRFHLRGLDGERMGYIAPELLVNEQGIVTHVSGKGIEIALQHGLIGWEHFANDAGPVRFSRANFRLIPYDVRAELAVEIVLLSAPDEEEKKT
jgi:hypothetical protein